MNPTKNDLKLDQRTQLVELLNERLADLIDLSLQAKQAHWNVKGPHFIGLHELFDQIHTDLAPLVDEVAERLVALGGMAEGTVQAISRRTALAAYPASISSGRDHVDAFSSALASAGKQIRASIDKATELGDADTADLFTEISRDLDKKLWFVESHLQGER